MQDIAIIKISGSNIKTSPNEELKYLLIIIPDTIGEGIIIKYTIDIFLKVRIAIG